MKKNCPKKQNIKYSIDSLVLILLFLVFAGSLNTIIAQAPVVQNDEFLVNSNTSIDHGGPVIAIDHAGGFVIAWTTLHTGPEGSEITTRRYNNLAQPLGTDFTVNTFSTNIQVAPALAINEDGVFVITWQSSTQDGDGWGVYGQFYDASGATVGSEFRVNDLTTGFQTGPSVATDGDGNFFITYFHLGNNTFGRFYDKTGTVQGNAFSLFAGNNIVQGYPDVAMTHNGEFIVSWHVLGGVGDALEIKARRYTSAGLVNGGIFPVNTHTPGDQQYVATAMDRHGNSVLTWQDSDQGGIYAQRFDAIGQTIGVEFRVNLAGSSGSLPDIAMDNDGDFIIVWTSEDVDDSGVYGQRYNADGIAKGSEFLVNTTTTGTQNGASVAMDADGDYIIAWAGNGTGDDVGIFAKRYLSDNPNPNFPQVDANIGLSVDEGGTQLITLSELTASDMENSASEIIFTMSSLPANGTLYNDVTPLVLNESFTQEDINNSLISYQHDGSETTSDLFNFILNDDTNFLDEETFAISINPQDDAPVLEKNEGLAVFEGLSSTITDLILKATDEDNVTTELIFQITQETINGTLDNDGTPMGLNDSFTQEDIDNGFIDYNHDGSSTLSDSFKFTLTDGNSVHPESTFNITVDPENDAPVIATNEVLAAIEDETVTLSNAHLQTTDVDTSPDMVEYSLTLELPAYGSLKRNGSTLILNDVFTQADINNNLITYTHEGNQTQTVEDFYFVVTDGNTALTQAQFNISITLVDDPPILLTNLQLTVAEGNTETIRITELDSSDPDNTDFELVYTITDPPDHGTLIGGQLAINGTFFQGDINNNSIGYHHDGDEEESDTFKFTVSDGTSTLPEEIFTFSITPANDPPELITNEQLTVNEGNTGIINNLLLEIADPDNSPAEIVYTIKKVPGWGTIENNGIELTLESTFTQLDLNNEKITFLDDGTSLGNDSFRFVAGDGDSFLDETSFFITITLNTAPVLVTNEDINLNEGGSVIITSAFLQVTDDTNTDDKIIIKIEQEPSNGTLSLQGTVLQIDDTFTQQDINNELLAYIHDGNESTTDSFGFTTSDGTDNGESGTFIITVDQVDDPPILNINIGLSLNKGTESSISNVILDASDPDNSDSEIIYKFQTFPKHGTVRKDGLPLEIDDFFTQVDINSFLITYSHDGSETTFDSFNFTVGDGSIQSIPSTFSITINLNDVEKDQTISFNSIPQNIEGAAPFTLNANASSGLAVEFSVVTGPATIDGNQVTLLGPGLVTIRASQPGDGTFNAAADVDQSFCVIPTLPSISMTMNNESLTLQSSSNNGNQWFLNGVALLDATDQSYVVDQVGDYMLQVTIDGCISDLSDAVSIVLTDIDNNPANGVLVYPNPTNNYLNIEIVHSVTSELHAIIFDAKGLIVQDLKLHENHSNNYFVLDVAELKPGVYLYLLSGGNIFIQGKFRKD